MEKKGPREDLHNPSKIPGKAHWSGTLLTYIQEPQNGGPKLSGVKKLVLGLRIERRKKGTRV